MQTDVMSNKQNLILPQSVSTLEVSATIETQSSVVIVGANGSGKTRLGSWIELKSPQKSLVHRVAAQKSLLIPDFCSTSSIDIAENTLLYGLHQPNVSSEDQQSYKNTYKWESKPNTHLQNDFDKLLTYLFTEEFDKSTKYRQQVKANGISEPPPETRLDIIKRIWEFVLPHRELTIGAGKIEVSSRHSTGSSYHASEMSDGERVIFYLIGQCLAAKTNGIIVIDEPETHIHKALQSRLWDAVEAERPDCLFVYLTHDLDFAVTRLDAIKVWLKSYENNQWDWHLILGNEDVPERLLLEIIGSRKPILFVEGDLGSLDYFFFSRLFKKFTVTPCGGHEQVINSTCSFSKLKNLHNLECKGIIDRDFRTDENVEYLRQRGVFCLNFSEIENLLLSENVLSAVATMLNRTEDAAHLIEQTQQLVFNLMENQKERLVSAIVAARIEYILSRFDAEACGEAGLIKALDDVTNGIDIPGLYEETNNLVENILRNKKYSEALRLYNNKGLLNQVSSLFGFKANKDNNELVNYIKRLINSRDNRMIIEAFQQATPELVSLS
jgi:energy-coupling factor transporter ATP-binding protein EcfA2